MSSKLSPFFYSSITHMRYNRPALTHRLCFFQMPIIEYSFTIELKNGSSINHRKSGRFPENKESREYAAMSAGFFRDLGTAVHGEQINSADIASTKFELKDLYTSIVLASAMQRF